MLSGAPLAQTTQLIGRAREREAIARWVASDARLLTLAGPPGVGKSRLAYDLATRDAKAVVCPLGACRSAADVERALQRALGRVSRARLTRALGAFDGLIVLDRFEHLVVSARPLIEDWIAEPGARFVITTREPLGLFGETTLVLGPLDEADAVALYAARAGRDIDGAAAARIVRRLDHLPLAIELAAARASVLSDTELLARLERGIDRGLRSTIAWSIDLLDDDERATLFECAIFRGAFDADGAERVAHGVRDTVGCLVALERKNLLRRVHGGLALYDAVREIAHEALARSGRLEATALRHAELQLDRAEAASFADLAAAEAFMRPRDPCAAARLTLALDAALAGQAPSPAHIDTLAAAMACGDPVLRARVLLARARAFRLRGSVSRGIADLREALALARHAEARDVEADVLRLLGVTARQLSRPHRARVLLRSALAIQESLARAGGAAMALDDLGVVAHDLGELTVARTAYERALSLARVAGDRRFEGIALGHLGVVAHDLGSLDEALELQRAALEKHREADDRRFEGFAHAFIAALHLEAGALDEAKRSVDDALAIDARLGDVDSGAVLAGITCVVAAAEDRIVSAREIVDRARRDLAGREDSALRRALDVFALSIALAEARRASEEGRPDDAGAHRTAVEAALRHATPRSVEERLAARVVARALERDVAASSAIDVAKDGSWFEARGKRVSLTTRRALAGVLARLAEERTLAAGRAVSIEALFRAGWPGERVAEKSARRRVYVAVDTLRSLGLGTALVQQDRGYFLGSPVRVIAL